MAPSARQTLSLDQTARPNNLCKHAADLATCLAAALALRCNMADDDCLAAALADGSRQRRRELPISQGCPAGSRRPMLRPAGAWGASSALERGRAAGTEEMHLLFQRLSAKSHLRPQVLSRDPWILVLDNWASEAEASTMIKAAGDRWSPDITYGSSVNSNYRNSSSFNVRLGSQEARAAAFARHFARMEYELGVGIEHADGIALLKYHPGGFYRKHHDYILPSVASAEPRGFKHCGNRQLTFMVYLSDLPEGGEGGTSYFHLGINVKPKAGRAVLWTNVFANNTFYKDERTAHEALTVRRGVKYVATTWFQAYDHRGNDENRCC